MPTYKVNAEFDATQGIKNMESFFDRLEQRSKQAMSATDKAVAKTGDMGRGVAKAVEAGTKELDKQKKLFAEVRAELAQFGSDKVGTTAFEDIRRKLELIRATLINTIRQNQDAWSPKQMIAYSSLLDQVTNKLDNITSGRSGLEARTAGFKTFINDAKILDQQFSILENKRTQGRLKLEEYRKEMQKLLDTANKRASNAASSDFERSLFAGRAKQAQRLLNQADSEQAKDMAEKLRAISRGLADNKLQASEASQKMSLLAQRAGEMAKAQGVSKEAAARYLAIQDKIISAKAKQGYQSLTDQIKAMDQRFTLMEIQRERGISTLDRYKQELKKLNDVAFNRSQREGLTGAERAIFAARSQKAQRLIDQADAKEAKKIESGIKGVQQLLERSKVSSEQAGNLLELMAKRAEKLAQAQNTSTEAARRYLDVANKIAVTQDKIKAAATPTARDLGIEGAKASLRELQDLNRRKTAGLLGPDAAQNVKNYERELRKVLASTRQQAQNTRLSTAAQKEYAKAAEQATLSLRRLRAEQINLGTGGSAAFALGSVAFGYGGLGAGTGIFVQQALELNEDAKQAALTLDAVAKFNKQNVVEALKASFDVAEDIRQDPADVQQAMANLLRKGFNPEMAKETIERFADAANAAGLQATKAVRGASEAILSEQSRQLNTAGIAENLGPELSKMNAALKKGEEYFRTSFLLSDKARDYFQELRDSGKSFEQAAKGVTLWQFVMKATDPVAGRTAKSLDTLTGALDFANNNYKAFRRELVEGLSIAAIPVLKAFAFSLSVFNEAPDWIKSTIGFGVAIGALGLASIGAAAGIGVLVVQTRNLIQGEAGLNLMARARQATTTKTLALQRFLTTEIFKQGAATNLLTNATRQQTGAIVVNTTANQGNAAAVSQRAAASTAASRAVASHTTATIVNTGAMSGSTAATTAATAATGRQAAAAATATAGVRGLGVAAATTAGAVTLMGSASAFFAAAGQKIVAVFRAIAAANPFTLALVGAAAIAAWRVNILNNITEVYNKIEELKDGANKELISRRGKPFADALNEYGLLQEIIGDARQKLAQAEKEGDSKGISLYRQRIRNGEIRKKQLQEILKFEAQKRKAEAGSTTATYEQVLAYKRLKDQLDGIAERFGDMKMTAFQKDVRSLRKEYDRLLAAIAKQEKAFADSQGKRGINQQQAKELRALADRLIPEGTANLITREVNKAAEARRKALADMEKDELALIKDGIAKRKAQFAIETKNITAEYKKRILEVRKNREDPLFDLNEKGISAEERNKRLAQQKKFAQIELDLINERDAKIKSRSKILNDDLINLRQQRADRLLQIARQEAEKEISILEALGASIEQAREQAITSTGTDRGVLQVEQRFADKQIELARRTANLKASIERAEAQNTYQKALRDAQSLGQEQAEAVKTAQRTLQKELQLIELNRVNAVNTATLQSNQRLNSARVKLVQDVIDTELEGIDELEGAWLAALRRRYAAEEAASRARGDRPGAEAYKAAIKRIDEEAKARIEKVNEVIIKAGESLTTLGQKLDELEGKAAKGLLAAQTAAASPFENFIRQRQKEIADLNNARASLINPDQQLLNQINTRIGQLRSFVSRAERSRDQAVDIATYDFLQKEYDKQMKERARILEKQYSNGRLKATVYVAGLEAERSYWQARLKGLEEGSSEYETVRRRLEEVGDKLRSGRIAVADEPLDTAQLLLRWRDAQNQITTTEEQRNVVAQERIALLEKIAKLERDRINNPDLNAREQDEQKIKALQAQAKLNAARKEEQNRLNENIKSVRDLAAAQLDYAEKVAQTDAQSRGALRARLELARNLIGDQTRLINQAIARGEPERVINQLKAQQIKLLGDLAGAEERLLQASLERMNRELEYTTRMGKVMLERAGLIADEVGEANEAYRIAEERVRVMQRTLELAKSQKDQAAAQINLEEAINQKMQARSNLAKAQLDYRSRQLEILNAEADANLAKQGLSDDQVANAEKQAIFAEAELNLARERQKLSKSLREQDDARLDVAKKQADLSKAELAVSQARKQEQEQFISKGLEYFQKEQENERKKREDLKKRRQLAKELNIELQKLDEVYQGQESGTDVQRALRKIEKSFDVYKKTEQQANEAIQKLQLASFGRLISYEEGQKAKEAISSLTQSVRDYRQAWLDAANAYRNQIQGIESLVGAVKQLAAVGNDQSRANQIGLNFAELQRVSALKELNQLLSDQNASYDELSAAASKLTNAEQASINAKKSELNLLADKIKLEKNIFDIYQLQDRLQERGLSYFEARDIANKAQIQGASALSGISFGISDEASEKLEQLRRQAQSALNDVDELRRKELEAQRKSEKALQDKKRLIQEERLINENAFNSVEAEEFSKQQERRRLESLFNSTRFQGQKKQRAEALADLKRQTEELAKQVIERKKLEGLSDVTLGDIKEQKQVNLAKEIEQSLTPIKLDTAREIEKELASLRRENALKTALEIEQALSPIRQAQAEQQGQIIGRIVSVAIAERIGAALQQSGVNESGNAYANQLQNGATPGAQMMQYSPTNNITISNKIDANKPEDGQAIAARITDQVVDNLQKRFDLMGARC